MYHLGASIRLLVVVGNGYGVELGLRTVAGEDAGGVFPRDGTARLHLCPGQAAIHATQVSALGNEVQHTTLTVLVAGIPVLYGRVLYLCPVLYHYLHDGGMQLVLVAHGGGTAFQIGHVGIIVAYYQGALELARAHGIDAEVGAQFHGASDALGDVDKTSVGEYGRVQCGEIVVAVWHHRAKIFAHQVGVVLHRLGDAAEDNALLLKLLLKGGLDRHAVHDGIHRHTSQCHTLLQGNAQLVEGLHQFRVNLLGTVLLAACRRVGIV